MKPWTMDRLRAKDAARATLAQRMITYLNHLEGAAERGDLTAHADTLQIEEAFMERRLAELPPIK